MASKIVPQDYYVYLHLRASTGEPFYVGKGVGLRAWSPSHRNKYWKNIVKKHGLKIQIVIDGLQEWAAIEKEKELIALYGRLDFKCGPLINLTDGGEGITAMSPETKQRHKDSYLQPAVKQKMRNAALRSHSKIEVQEKHKRTRATQTYKQNHKDGVIRAFAKPVICVTTGLRFASQAEAVLWLKQNGFPQANNGNISECCYGKRMTAYAHVWAFA
jgi:hypothetical protein